MRIREATRYIFVPLPRTPFAIGDKLQFSNFALCCAFDYAILNKTIGLWGDIGENQEKGMRFADCGGIVGCDDFVACMAKHIADDYQYHRQQ